MTLAGLAPVLAVGGPVAVVAVILRYGPDAIVRLLAGTVAVLTRDEQRGVRCVEVLQALRRDRHPIGRNGGPATHGGTRSQADGWPTGRPLDLPDG